MALINAALARVVHDEFAASAKAIGKIWMPVEAVAYDSSQKTEPAEFMARGRPLAIAGVPAVTVRTRTVE